MPELPEVETTARELRPLVKGKIFHGLWSAHGPMLRRPRSERAFLQMIRGEKILDVGRRGKIVWFRITSAKNLFVHQKLSGHLVYGRWRKQKNAWTPADAPTRKLMQDPTNRFLRLLFFFQDGSALALSDVRKFGRAYAVVDAEIERVPELKIGPDPLAAGFHFEALKPLLVKRSITIKQALLDQRIIAGIGNIYADEILWQAKISPLKKANALGKAEYERLARAIPFVLQKAVGARGTSIDNYRRPSGALGRYQKLRRVYRREGESCPRCGAKIKRVKIAARSAHFCSRCQA